MINSADRPGLARPSRLFSILACRCPRCRRGHVFRLFWIRYENCPHCQLDFDRGEPGYYTGALYVAYTLAIPLLTMLTLFEHVLVPSWSMFRLIVQSWFLCIPLMPLIWQYSLVLWINFDQWVDPAEPRRKRSWRINHKPWRIDGRRGE
jgi:uncharacterized protein (DUF983 family)